MCYYITTHWGWSVNAKEGGVESRVGLWINGVKEFVIGKRDRATRREEGVVLL
jgi:hypothetical protein